MLVKELHAQLTELVDNGFGSAKVFDTDGHPVIIAHIGDDVEDGDQYRVYIESEF